MHRSTNRKTRRLPPEFPLKGTGFHGCIRNMLIGVVASLLTAVPSLAAPGFQCSGVEPALCDAYLEHFVARLTERQVKVTTKNDLAQILGAERQRQLLGCTEGDSASCLTELVGALGVAKLLSGTVAKTDSLFLSTLKIIDAQNGATLWAATRSVSSERELLAFFDEQGSVLVNHLSGAPTSVAASTTPVVVKWIPAMVGGVALIIGGALQAVADTSAQRLNDYIRIPQRIDSMLGAGYTVENDIVRIASNGRAAQRAGIVLFGVGGAAIATSILWALLTPSKPVTAFLLPAPRGATLGLTMELP